VQDEVRASFLEALLAPFLFAIPVAFAGTLWRLWQLIRSHLPPGRFCRWIRVVLTLVHVCLASWLLYMAGRCIWPGSCGEGFASGFAAGAVGLAAAFWAFLWLLGEGLMLFCKSDAPQSDEH